MGAGPWTGPRPQFRHLGSSLEPKHVDGLDRGFGRQVRSNQGFIVPLSPAKGRVPADWVIVPAIGERTPEPLAAALAMPETQAAARLLRQWADHGARVAAACIGTFIAAESGVLDGETATTTWWLAPFFRQRYPHVRLEDARMLVRSGRVLTAGAALSHMDMALWLIRQASPLLAETTARYLIVDSRPSQAAYAMSDHLAHADPVVQKFERWARKRLSDVRDCDGRGMSHQMVLEIIGVCDPA